MKDKSPLAKSAAKLCSWIRHTVPEWTPEVDKYLLKTEEILSRKLDKCAWCLGVKGGAPGNEHVINGHPCCDYCHALMVGEKRSEWQPIETAPRDGTPILLWLEEPILRSHVQVGWFMPNIPSGVIGGHMGYDVPKPLFWQPLPPLPEPPQETR